jgi:hypothetical protein
MNAGSGCPPGELADAHPSGLMVSESSHGRRATVAPGFRTSRPAGARRCPKFFDELNDLGWDLQLQAHKVERDAHKMKSRAEKTTRISISPRDNCADVLQELVRPSTGKYLPEKFEIVPVSIRQ